jgi:predicted nucleic acid-binding protein
LQIREYPDLLKALSIRVETQSLWANLDLESLARSQGLAAYDAACLNLARRTGLLIATLDGPLKKAANIEGVGVIE